MDNLNFSDFIGLDYSRLPSHLAPAIQRYIEEGIIPGDFLQAVIRNNLIDAVCRADPSSFAALKTLVQFFHNEAPSQCWKSAEAMGLWKAQKGARG